MRRSRRFQQVDVFTAVALRGNPVAVVLDGDELSTDEMQQFANWTNLSETTFIVPTSNPDADYRVRIFTTNAELPFAGHPTIGTCHAWLLAGGQPKTAGTIVQECGLGLVTLRSFDGRLAFAAPELLRSGPVDDELVERAARVLDIDRNEIVDARWADNGPGWIALRLASVEAVLALKPNFGAEAAYDIGVVGTYPLGVVGSVRDDQLDSSIGVDPAIEVRAFFRSGGIGTEDPVTGSLNAALAQWLLSTGELTAPYIAQQGTALGRAGRVFVNQDDDAIWVGGDAVTVIDGTVEIGEAQSSDHDA